MNSFEIGEIIHPVANAMSFKGHKMEGHRSEKYRDSDLHILEVSIVFLK